MSGVLAGNLFADIQGAGSDGNEDISEILVRPGLKIERIVSHGHASLPGFWYEQVWDEWVIVLSGSAKLRFEDEAEARLLVVGDYSFIPARKRHRVDWTCGVNRLRTVDQDRLRRVDHPSGLGDEAPSLVACSEA